MFLEVQVQIRSLLGESSRAPAGLPSPSRSSTGGQEDGEKRESEPGPARYFGHLLGRENRASGASNCQTLPNRANVFRIKRVRACMFLPGQCWLSDASLRPLWFGSCP